jgi:hypothetical protein
VSVSFPFFRPKDAEALRHVGKMLYLLILEAGPNFGPEGESLTEREMQAGLADLLHTRNHFWYVGRQAEQSGLSVPDTRLSLVAKEIAAALDKIITVLQERLA